MTDQNVARTQSVWQRAAEVWGRRDGSKFLPDGRWVPQQAWAPRHRWVLALLWLHVPALFLFAAYVTEVSWLGARFAAFDPVHALLEVGIVAVFAVGASLPQLSQRLRAISAAIGLTTCSALLVHFSGGMVEAHFHFLVVLVVVSLYQDWLPLGLSISYVALHHSIAGTIDPASVYNHPAALAHPVRWAFVHAFFVMALSTAAVVHWRTAGLVRSHVDEVVAAATEGIIGIDPTGRVSVMNDAAERLVGPRERVLGQPLGRVVGNRLPGLLGSNQQLLSLADGQTRRGRGIRFLAGEEACFVDWSSTPIMGKEAPVGAVLTLRDVTERHLAESRLRERERKLSAAQRIAHVGSIEWAPVSGVLRVSEETIRIAERGHGKSVHEFDRLEDFILLLHSDDRDPVRAAFEEVHRTGTAIERDCRVGTASGVRHCELRIQLDEATDHGEPLRLVHASLHDVTDRVHAEDMRRRGLEQEREIQLLIEQDSFKNKFINAVAHELNTPLTPLRLQLHLLKMDADHTLSERQRRAVRMLERNVQRFGSLVNDLLDAARLQGGRMKMTPTLLDLTQVAEEAIEHFEGVMLEKDVVLETDVEADAYVMGDHDRLLQVVYNLLSNACKFTPHGGSIAVNVRRLGDEVLFQVRDTGIGISLTDQGRLFQPFTQVQDQMERTETGTGLGLYLCKGLIELHGGRIWCESDGKDRGATFGFSIPCAAVGRPRQATVEARVRIQEERFVVPAELMPRR